MSVEDGALGQIERLTASVVRNAVFLHGHGALGEIGFAAIVDEDIAAWIGREDHMGRLRCVKYRFRVVNDVDICTEPIGGQLPLLHMFKGELDKDAALKNLVEFRIFGVQQSLALRQTGRLALGRGHLCNPLLRLLEDVGNGTLVQHRLVSQGIELFTDTAVVVGRLIPTVHAVNDLQPGRHGLLGKVVTEHLQGRTRLRMNRAALRRPVLHRTRVVVNALYRCRTRLHPGLTLCSREAHIHHVNVYILEDRCGRQTCTRGGNRIQANALESLLGKSLVRKIRGEPAVNAVAVEEDGVLAGHSLHRHLLGLFLGHLLVSRLRQLRLLAGLGRGGLGNGGLGRGGLGNGRHGR